MSVVNPEPPAAPQPFPAPAPGVEPRRGPAGRTLLVAVATALVVAGLGVPLGLLWAALAPDVPVLRTATGGALTEPQPEQFVAADGWFSLLGLAFGVLVAVLGWVLLRGQRGPAGLVAVVVGGLGAAPLAWQVGRRIGLAEYQRLLETAPVGELISRPPDLRAGRFEWVFGFVPTLQGDLLVPAFAAAVTYTLLAGWSRYASLRPEPEPGFGLQPAGVTWPAPAGTPEHPGTAGWPAPAGTPEHSGTAGWPASPGTTGWPPPGAGPAPGLPVDPAAGPPTGAPSAGFPPADGNPASSDSPAPRSPEAAPAPPAPDEAKPPRD
ncbi:DUF2567 domain-containing protein [Polymorphospora rubra]|uniref:DUF2567 domain-containing protein n=1 Tax=Polymorphospora rubra TaxID=338584 RepID=UPI003F4CFA0D